MRLPTRTKSVTLPGTVGTARVARRIASLLPDLTPGDIAVFDQVDLDRRTALRLVEAGVRAVVNVSPMISGRFPNLGPQVLTDAGVEIIDRAGAGALQIRTGSSVRLHDGDVFAGTDLLVSGRAVDGVVVGTEMGAARTAMGGQVDTFVRASAQILGREEDLLLHGEGLPRLSSARRHQSALVVAPGPDLADELRRIRRYLREQDLLTIGVGTASDTLRSAGHRPDVVVLDSRDEDELPAVEVLKSARDVVVRVDPGGPSESGLVDSLTRLGIRPHRVETTLGATEVALLLADAAESRLIVGVALEGELEEMLDRGGAAGAHLVRLRLGPRLVDSPAVPPLYAGKVRPRHLVAVCTAGLAALAAAISVTPVGQSWIDQLQNLLP